MITKEIVSKWTVKYKDFYLVITEDKKVFDFKTAIELIEYWNNGTICFRYPRSTKKIGVKTINKYCKRESIVIQEYLPF